VARLETRCSRRGRRRPRSALFVLFHLPRTPRPSTHCPHRRSHSSLACGRLNFSVCARCIVYSLVARWRFSNRLTCVALCSRLIGCIFCSSTLTILCTAFHATPSSSLPYAKVICLNSLLFPSCCNAVQRLASRCQTRDGAANVIATFPRVFSLLVFVLRAPLIAGWVCKRRTNTIGLSFRRARTV
jgi:hypothetical protein